MCKKHWEYKRPWMIVWGGVAAMLLAVVTAMVVVQHRFELVIESKRICDGNTPVDAKPNQTVEKGQD